MAAAGPHAASSFHHQPPLLPVPARAPLRVFITTRLCSRRRHVHRFESSLPASFVAAAGTYTGA
jgi:hypothetical protein